MKRNRETQKERKLKALSSLFDGEIQNRRLMFTSPRKNLKFNLGESVFHVTKVIAPRLVDYSMYDFLTIKRINPEFD